MCRLAPRAASGMPWSQLWPLLEPTHHRPAVLLIYRVMLATHRRMVAASVLVWQKELPSTADPGTPKKKKKKKRNEKEIFCIHQHSQSEFCHNLLFCGVCVCLGMCLSVRVCAFVNMLALYFYVCVPCVCVILAFSSHCNKPSEVQVKQMCIPG